MAVPSPKKTPKDLKKPMKPKRKPLRKSLKPKKRPDIVDLTPPEGADQLLVKKKDGGNLKDIPSGNVGLSKLPTEVRNKMGFKASGGKVTKMGMGGKCRGMGAASRGGTFTRNG
jgi:hypothetical protein|tara:strand:- start:958 stop:1299 length:342 start_codon:yes stop_codon:yes gene_type:complete